jgi:hypothetical protein
VFARTHSASRTEKETTEIHAVLNPALKPSNIAAIMRILSVIIILATVGLTGLNNESQAQTVRDDSGETYFLSSVRSLCGPRAQVYLAPHSAKVVLSGEYLEDRNLDSIARNIALSGLNVFSDSEYFAVSIQDSKGFRLRRSASLNSLHLYFVALPSTVAHFSLGVSHYNG